MSFQYAYLFGCAVLLIAWVILFLFKKDTRKEMILISIIFGFAALATSSIYSPNWWSPENIFNTNPCLEDFLFGFSLSGIAAGVYPFLFKKKLKEEKSFNLKKEVEKSFNLVAVGGLMVVLLFSGYFLFNLNSLYASILAFLVPLFLIWVKRKDLILNSILSGIVTTFIHLIIFILVEFIFPGWVQNNWNFDTLSGLVFLKTPIEELIWSFLAGLLIGPLYEFWQEKKLK